MFTQCCPRVATLQRPRVQMCSSSADSREKKTYDGWSLNSTDAQNQTLVDERCAKSGISKLDMMLGSG